jgi:hypothetical protein
MTLTPRRLEAVKPILEKYRGELFSQHSFNCGRFEMELCGVLGTGYRGIKDVMCQIVGRKQRPPFEKPTDRYRQVAAYYMLHSNGGMVVDEFQFPLTGLFGAANPYCDDWGQKCDEYWEKTFAWGGVADRPYEETDAYWFATPA